MPDRRPPSRTVRAAKSKVEGPAAYAGAHETATGTVELTADRDDPDGWMVVVNGAPSSYVHLGDPTRLEFEYVRWIGDLLDVCAPEGEPLRVAHLGGAGCTLARYVAATRPRSPQVVFELDPVIVELMREAFAQDRKGFKLRAGDAREGVANLQPSSYDVMIRDAFDGDQVPPHLTTLEFVQDVARVLGRDGIYVANVADRSTQLIARAEAATMRAIFTDVALVAEPGQLRGRRYGNVLLLASNGTLPLDALTRRLASGAVRARLVPPDRVVELSAGIPPFTDAGF